MALAQLVGEALTHAQGHDGTEDAAEIRAITDAMVRLLIGAPLYFDGKLTIVSLATDWTAPQQTHPQAHRPQGPFLRPGQARDPLPEALPESARARAAKQQQDLSRVRAERDDLRVQT